MSKTTELRASNLKDEESSPLSILIADDHRLLVEAVASILDKSGMIVSTAFSLQETLDKLNMTPKPDITLLDVVMPGMVGLESVKAVVEAAKPQRVILFSSTTNSNLINAALDENVLGVIPKSLPLRSLVSVLNLVASGQVFLPSEIARQALEKPSRSAALTAPELFVLQLTAEGKINKEIAHSMNVNEATVKMHMRSLCHKIGARNRAHAVSVGRELGLI